MAFHAFHTPSFPWLVFAFPSIGVAYSKTDMSVLFKAIDVWKRLDDGGAIRYRCFELIPGGRFCVQSADFYRTPLGDKSGGFLDRQFTELFLQQAPDKREQRTFATLEEAIASHDEEFN
ncbi:MAG TPA: hypothetical protein VHX60_11020 [Acidobacteriaceae bacterium]|jgi:hypothetical protein|nr:hypothetical protein [Acidobacteriaceae bacterium]